MINNLYRKKLLHSILYFSKKVKYPSKTKIFKLLNFLDFMHFKQTGRSVTNLKYYAWEFGPVPQDFWYELENGIPEDFKKYLQINHKTITDNITEIDFFPIKPVDLSIFTPRERKIMDELIFVFKDISPTKISEISHLKNKPWDKTIREKGLKEEIDYTLAIDEDSQISLHEAELHLQDKEEFLNNYSIDKFIR